MNMISNHGVTVSGMLRCALMTLPASLLMTSVPVMAQSGFISRLDDNNNGYLEPNEISGRARGYFERFARDFRIDLSEPVSVRRLEYAARRYNERREDSSDRVTPDPASNIMGFGPAPDEPLVPGFGLPDVKYPYTQEDLDQADSVLRRSDRNDDGFLDRAEAQRARWSDTDPFDKDFNKDNRLSRLELAQRYAERRAKENKRSSSSSSYGDSASDDDRDNRSSMSSSRYGNRSRGSDRGSRYLASNVITRYDFNKNGQLEARELASAGIEPGKADFDRDGVVDRNELAEYLFQEMDGLANEMAEVLPVWFFENDVNGDRQIEMSEFASEWDVAKADEFNSYDLNQDGLITADELLKSNAIMGGKYSSQKAEYLLPRSTVVSEIVVDEDFIIGDLDVQLSITHTYVEHLDGYLIGPDGQRIELFTGVGRSDDHFEQTIFDDEADDDITRARAPFDGRFKPEAVKKKSDSLSEYKGTNLKGVWQLMIRSSRSDRSGILHNWSLIVEPVDEFED